MDDFRLSQIAAAAAVAVAVGVDIDDGDLVAADSLPRPTRTRQMTTIIYPSRVLCAS